MKKLIAIITTLSLIACLFAGCAQKSDNAAADTVYLVAAHQNAKAPAISSTEINNQVADAVENKSLLSIVELDGDPYVASRPEFSLKKGVSSAIKKRYINTKANELITAFNALKPKTSEADVLNGLTIASNELFSKNASEAHQKHLVVYSPGVSTTGLINMAKYNILGSSKDEIDNIIEELKGKNALPNLKGVTIDWYNLNEVNGEQKAFTSEMKSANEYLWGKLIESSGGQVNFNPDNADNTVKNYDMNVSTIPVAEDSLNLSEYNQDTAVSFTQDQIGFVSDSTEFIDKKKAKESVQVIVDYMIYNKDYKLLLAASTATVPSQDNCARFSLKRAQAVKKLILSMSGSKINGNRIITVGMGYENPFHVNDTDKDGNLIEKYAKQNRRVYAMNASSQEAKKLVENFT